MLFLFFMKQVLFLLHLTDKEAKVEKLNTLGQVTWLEVAELVLNSDVLISESMLSTAVLFLSTASHLGASVHIISSTWKAHFCICTCYLEHSPGPQLHLDFSSVIYLLREELPPPPWIPLIIFHSIICLLFLTTVHFLYGCQTKFFSPLVYIGTVCFSLEPSISNR